MPRRSFLCASILSVPYIYMYINIGIESAYSASICLSVTDTTVIEGGVATIVCGYAGEQSIVWNINGSTFTSSRLPAKHSVTDYSTSQMMVITDVDLEMNGSTYQCIAESMSSSILHLYVLPVTAVTRKVIKRNISSVAVDNIFMSINTDTKLHVPPTTLQHIESEAYHDHSREIIYTTLISRKDNPANCYDRYPTTEIGVVSALAPLAFILGCGSCAGIQLYISYCKKQKHTIAVQGPGAVQMRNNEAYQIVHTQTQRRKVESSTNPVYEQVT